MEDKDKKRPPLDPTQSVEAATHLHLAFAMSDGLRGAAQQMEAVGQRSFIGSDSLPTRINRGNHRDPKAVLEAAGVKFLGPVEGDKLFQFVELPAGWTKVATDHEMTSHLVDDKGRRRARIFYKAQIYDRRADMTVLARFSVELDYDRMQKEGVAVAMVMDGGQAISTTEPVQIPRGDDQSKDELTDRVCAIAEAWLDANHPGWRIISAYWD